MKKILLKIATLAVSLVLCFGLFACNPGGTKKPADKPTKLLTPEVTVGNTGLAVWSPIDHCVLYAYVIDEGAEKLTAKCQLQLEEGQTIKVKATSENPKLYADSDFSAPQTYHKLDVDPDHEHADVNEDGLCDIGGESVTVELSFYAINDLHGKFMDTSSQPGVDELTTYIKDLYADPSREEILLSSGDMWQGTVESSSNRGQLMTEWMNELGFSSMTLGNHEYDWGADVLLPNSKMAKFPFLAINVLQDGIPAEYCQASTVVERGGLKIGIIGAIGDCLSSISGDHTAGLSFKTGSALTLLVKEESIRLREQEGCDFIVYSIHDGGSGFSSSGVNSVTNSDMNWYDSALSNGYVDLVFEGHSHKQYILQDEHGVYHLQGGGENKCMSRAEVSYNIITKKFTVSPDLVSSSEYARSSIEGDSIVWEIFESYFPDENPYSEIGKNSMRRGESDILPLVAELYFRKGVEVWGEQYDIVLGGGYLNVRSPYYVYAGGVAYADLFSILPFDNDLVLGKIQGRYLKSRFLASGSSYYRYGTIEYGDVVDNATYYIIVDSYTSTYSPNRIEEVARLEGRIYARDLLADFVRAGGWA